MVYVGIREYKFGRMKMSYMMADDLEELHAMALSIGVSRKHFQDKKRPHYDVCKTKKKTAIELGAIEVSDREFITLKS